MEPSGKLVLMTYNTCQYIYLFRRPLIRHLKALGYLVVVAAPLDWYAELLWREDGLIVYGLRHMQGRGMNPIKDLACLAELVRLYKDLSPFAVLHYTIKPNIYGSIAARIHGIPAINNVTGLGELFARDSFAQRMVRVLDRKSTRLNSSHH